MSESVTAEGNTDRSQPVLQEGLGVVGSAAGDTVGGLGERLKALRLQAGLSLRELARQADVSPSLVSQIENGKSRPSVSTLYTFARLLNVAVDELFEAEGDVALRTARHSEGLPRDPASVWHPSEYANRISVVHPSHRAHLHMGEGIDWERLAATPEQDVNFMKITYAPGVSSSDCDELQTHEGYEYGYVLAGTLEVTVGNEVFVLREGESLGFDSRIPHQLRNAGDTEFQGIWFVHGRGH
ncbi:MAG: putative Transcriptional regulator [Frankiales bacterium]|nr:putative Transcriptional regulator [Frankiales bacterium]